MNLWKMIFPPSVADQEVRAEIWRLGSRHRGAALDGALSELKDAGLTPGRTVLLRACVQRLRAQAA